MARRGLAVDICPWHRSSFLTTHTIPGCLESPLATTPELRDLLVRTSWWAEPRTWILRDPDLRRAREAPFEYSAGVLNDLVPGGLYLLRGPRRVGKSVEVKKTVEQLIGKGVDPRRVIHIAADEFRASDLRRVVDAAADLTPRGGRRYWFIDEITAIRDGWPPAIKTLRDNDPRFAEDTVVLTGSSAANLTQAVKALAGRRGNAVNSDRVMLPMSFRNFVDVGSGTNSDAPPGPPPQDLGPVAVADLTSTMLSEAVRTLAPWLNRLVSEWEIYLAVGGFPQAVAAHEDGDSRIGGAFSSAFSPAFDIGVPRREVLRVLKQDLLDVIHGEAFGQSAWSRTQTDAFVQRLAKGIASPTNSHDIATDTGTSGSTVRRRIDALRESFVVWPCHREHNLRPALRSQEKTYFTDPIYTRLSPHAQRTDFGLMSEQQLGMALVRSFVRDDPAGYLNFDAVLHHRTPTRKEIDFVGPGFGGLAIESKYADGERWRRATRTMRASRWRGVTATRSALDLSDPEVLAVPTAVLVWLIGG